MFCGVFLQSKPAGRRAKTGLCGWGILQGSGDCVGLPYLVVWDGAGGILQNGGECRVGLPHLAE